MVVEFVISVRTGSIRASARRQVDVSTDLAVAAAPHMTSLKHFDPYRLRVCPEGVQRDVIYIPCVLSSRGLHPTKSKVSASVIVSNTHVQELNQILALGKYESESFCT